MHFLLIRLGFTFSFLFFSDFFVFSSIACFPMDDYTPLGGGGGGVASDRASSTPVPSMHTGRARRERAAQNFVRIAFELLNC